VKEAVMRATIDPPRTVLPDGAETMPAPDAPDLVGPSAVRPVILPLDGSALSERARPWAVAIARTRQAPVIMMGVVDAYQASSLGLAASAGIPLYNSMVPDALQEVTQYLETQVGACAAVAPDVHTQGLLKIGDASREILKVASELDAQMVVLTTHGRGGVDRLIWGSVAEQVVRNGRVLVPLDGTKLAETSLAEATRLAVGGELLLVRDVVSGQGDWSDDLTEPREATDMAKSYLDGVANRLREDGIRVRTLVLTRPVVTDAISEVVSTEAIDLIVLATHGRGAIGRLLHGSVSDALARHAPVPVLLIHRAPEVPAS
jgi:nucleotide-binding universal stress UspA family protein